MTALCRATVDTSALQHNLRVVRGLSGGARILAVIKADAYGHGLVPVARALAGADALAVARIEEGAALRAAGISQRIVLLQGVFNRRQLALAASHGFDLVVHSQEQLALLESFAGRDRFTAWVKIDTGMNRLGFRPDEFAEAYRRLQSAAAVREEVVLMTHLACADEPEHPATARQLALFESTTAGIKAERSIANSAGLVKWPGSRADWVRPGIMLYGVSPFAGSDGSGLGLKPVMTLATRVIAIRQVLAGESVGYGATWVAPRDMRLGVAAIGYADGYTRHLVTGTAVLVGHERVPLVGRVSMDMITLDLSGHRQARVGDRVTLWGQGLAVEEIASSAATIPYHLLCGVTQRVEREYL